MVSNNISMYDNLIFARMKGIVPYIEINIHEIPTAPNPCIVESFLVGNIFFLMRNENTKVTTERINNEFANEYSFS